MSIYETQINVTQLWNCKQRCEKIVWSLVAFGKEKGPNSDVIYMDMVPTENQPENNIDDQCKRMCMHTQRLYAHISKELDSYTHYTSCISGPQLGPLNFFKKILKILNYRGTNAMWSLKDHIV